MNTTDSSPFGSFLPLTSSRVVVALLFAAGVTLMAGACARPQAQTEAPPPPQVTVAEVSARDVSEWDEFTGRLEAVNTVTIRPRVSGAVTAVRFAEGALVRKGDLLFEIDARPFEAEAARLRAELLRAKATVGRASAELKRGDRLATDNAISPEDRGRRSSFAEESAAQVAAVEAALSAAELNLEFTLVRAPINGRVGRAVVTPGNLVSSGPGEATVLTTVVSLDPIYATFDADEHVFLRYEAVAPHGVTGPAALANLPVQMALASDSGFPRKGSVKFLDNQVDASSGTIRARAVFRNADTALTPGLFVRLRLPGTATYRGLLVEDRAIGTDLDKRFVFVLGAGNVIEYRPVTLGPIVDGLRVVRSGLNVGDRIVVNGLQRVRPGTAVTPMVEPAGSDKSAAAQAGSEAHQ